MHGLFVNNLIPKDKLFCNTTMDAFLLESTTDYCMLPCNCVEYYTIAIVTPLDPD